MEEINLSGLRTGCNEQPPQWDERGHCNVPRRTPVVLCEKMPEDIEGLVKELNSAVEEYERLVSETKTNIEKAEEARYAAEKVRAKAEELRIAAEEERAASEAARQSAYALIESTLNAAESDRIAAETLRQAAEALRQSTFETNEAARADAHASQMQSQATAYTNAENNRNGAYQEAEEDRDEIFNRKEATRDAANEAALNCADALAALGPKCDQNTTNIANLQQAIDEIEPIVINGNVTNAPDEEDVTTDSNNLLKLKDRPTAVNQKGYKILRKGVALSTQMTDTNTIYEVRYVFDLDGGSLAIPSNCTLRFVGGTIANGSLVFDNTLVIGSYRLAFDNIVFSGTIANDEINVTHFGIVPGNNCYTRLSSLLAVCDIGRRVKVYFPTGKYTINGILHPSSFTEMYGDGEGSIIYNEATSGSAKCIIICSNCGALSTTLVVKDNVPKYAVLGYENGAGREGYYDFTKVRVEGAGADDYVIGDYAIFTKNRISDGRYSKYCIERIIDVSQDGADYILTLEHPASMPADDVTTWVLTTNVAKYESNSAIKRNIYVHDLTLWQEYEHTTSGYYAFGGGYNCKFENLYIRGCTPYGSNFSAYCEFININCTFTDGVWDAAELNYYCRYKNVSAKRIGLSATRQNIGMQISNGSDILMENIDLDFTNSSQALCLGGDNIDNIRINGVTIKNVRFFSGTTRKCVFSANANTKNRFENIKLVNVTFNRSTSTNLQMLVFNATVGGTIRNITTENLIFEGTASNTPNSIFHSAQNLKLADVDASDNEHDVIESERNYGISATPFLSTFAKESVHGFRFYNLARRIADNKCVVVKVHGYMKCVRELPNATQLWIYVGASYSMITTGLPFKYVDEKCSCDLDILFIKDKIYFRGCFKTNEWEASVYKAADKTVSDGSVIISLAARTINGDSLQNPAHIFVDTTSTCYVLDKIPITLSLWADARTTTYLAKSGASANRPSLAATAIGNQYFDTDLGKKLYWDGTKWIEEDGEAAGIARSGAFANVPTPTNVGFQYFCTSGASIDGGTTEKTNIVIYYTGSGWVDANGNAVVAKA